jgi:ComF family protein
MAGWVGQLERWLVPPRCLLCGAAGTDTDLCSGCMAELPVNDSCCGWCALPLPAPVDVCGRCLRRPPPWRRAWAPFRYQWPLDRLESRFKFSGHLACGRVLAERWCAAAPWPALPDLWVPVPLHRHRLRERGFNQAVELARALGRRTGLPVRTDVLHRVRGTVAQTDLDAVARRRNVRGAFRADHVAGLHVAIVDDVMTTGATVSECTRVLLAAGAASVDVWALARR